MRESRLDYAIRVLTVENKQKYLTSGRLEPDTEVICLRPNASGYYLPNLAYVHGVTKTGRITVDLWKDRDKRVTVSRKSILWAPSN